MQNELNPIVSIRAVVMNDEGLIAMARRASGGEQAGMWEFLGGGVGLDEQPLSAALREAHEEAGIIAYPISAVEKVEDRIIPDGKHAGRLYVGLGVMAVARAPFDRLEPREDVEAVGWFPPDEISQMPNITPTTRAAARKFL